MDLFNKKKISALQSDITSLNNTISKLKEEKTDLSVMLSKSKEKVCSLEKFITNFFKPKYVNKYFAFGEKPGIVHYTKCNDLEYVGDYFVYTGVLPSGTQIEYKYTFEELKNMRIITKKEFYNGGCE